MQMRQQDERKLAGAKSGPIADIMAAVGLQGYGMLIPKKGLGAQVCPSSNLGCYQIVHHNC